MQQLMCVERASVGSLSGNRFLVPVGCSRDDNPGLVL